MEGFVLGGGEVAKSELHFLKITLDALKRQGQKLKQEKSLEETAVCSEMMVVQTKVAIDTGGRDGFQLLVRGTQSDTVKQSYLNVNLFFQIIKKACSPIVLRDVRLRPAMALWKIRYVVKTRAGRNLSPQGLTKR